MGPIQEVLASPQFADRSRRARPITWRQSNRAVTLDIDSSTRLVVLGSRGGPCAFEPTLIDLLVPWELVASP